MRLISLILVMNLFYVIGSKAQDPFFTHFHGAESMYNPAMTGIKGALSAGVKHKSQWGNNSIAPFKTGIITLESSTPCTILDYGLAFGFDQEGDGKLNTYDFGLKLSGSPGFALATGALNLRFGLNFQFSRKSVDYSRFTFSDQLDPKYGLFDALGNSNPTSFIAPNDGRSLWFFTPAVGTVINYASDPKKYSPFAFQAGFAILNAYSLGRRPLRGNVESLLGLNVDIPPRYNLFLRPTFTVLDNSRTFFFSITPSVLFQKQDQLHYWESGVRLGFSRFLGLGIYYHSSGLQKTDLHTNWMTFNFELGEILDDYKNRVDLGASFSWNQSGIKNFAGPTFELSFTYYFSRSPLCALFGKDDDLAGRRPTPCPWDINRNKIYENIWYKTLNIKQ